MEGAAQNRNDGDDMIHLPAETDGPLHHITSLQVLSHWTMIIRESGRSLSGIEISLVD